MAHQFQLSKRPMQQKHEDETQGSTPKKIYQVKMDTFFCFKFSDECCHRTFHCCRPPAMAAVSLLKWAWVFVETRTVAHLCGRRTASLQSPTPRCSEAFVMKLQAAKWNANCKENLFQLVSLTQSTKAPSLQELMFEFQLTFDTQKLAAKSSVFLHLHLR